jgi:hypothetical protein
MTRHLTDVKVAAPAPPHAFQGWCETCQRDIGPRFEGENTADMAEQICAAHEDNPTLSDYALVASLTAVPGRTGA